MDDRGAGKNLLRVERRHIICNPSTCDNMLAVFGSSEISQQERKHEDGSITDDDHDDHPVKELELIRKSLRNLRDIAYLAPGGVRRNRRHVLDTPDTHASASKST